MLEQTRRLRIRQRATIRTPAVGQSSIRTVCLFVADARAPSWGPAAAGNAKIKRRARNGFVVITALGRTRGAKTQGERRFALGSGRANEESMPVNGRAKVVEEEEAEETGERQNDRTTEQQNRPERSNTRKACSTERRPPRGPGDDRRLITLSRDTWLFFVWYCCWPWRKSGPCRAYCEASQ